jgi:hypothetical protein
MFRGKALSDGRWRYGDLYHHKSGACAITENGANHEVIPETVGEYTGLKDRFGFDIFEGDVVMIDPESDNPRNVYVTFSNGAFNISEYSENNKEILC